MAVSDLSELISDAGNELGFDNLKDKQVEVITSFCELKRCVCPSQFPLDTASPSAM